MPMKKQGLQDINVFNLQKMKNKDCQENQVSHSSQQGETLKAKEDELHVNSDYIYMQMVFTYRFFLMRKLLWDQWEHVFKFLSASC